jgi:phosphatidylserine/phosphatidylglycerophosphate/cardiolipin synthase-like enzyme
VTARAPLGVRAAGVSLVPDATYYETIRHVIDHATACCLASVFIVDLNAHHDPDIKVLQVMKALQGAAWRGVEVKLLIGGSTENLAIAEACRIGLDAATSLGLDCRLLAGAARRGSHSKLVTVDDYVLAGSHNWSLSAFSGQVQDSLLIRSEALASYVRALFFQQWMRADAAGNA